MGFFDHIGNREEFGNVHIGDGSKVHDSHVVDPKDKRCKSCSIHITWPGAVQPCPRRSMHGDRFMDAIELVRKDTNEVVAWACGRCHQVPGISSGSGKQTPETIELMQSSAENCCRCSRCNGYRVRNYAFGLVCESCAPAEKADEEIRMAKYKKESERRDSARAASLKTTKNKESALLLLVYMEQYSEEHWCAGWLIGIEFMLWESIFSSDIGAPKVEEDINRIAMLTQKCDGWWYWDDTMKTQLFVSTEKWIEMYNARKKN